MSLRHLILNNFAWKLLSFSLAVMIWFAVRTSIHLSIPPSSPLIGQAETRVYMRLPVTVLTAPNDPRDFRIDPPTVGVTVSGTPETLHTLRAADLIPYVRLAQPGQNPDLRRRVFVSAPPGIAVTRIAPADVRVEDVSALK